MHPRAVIASRTMMAALRSFSCPLFRAFAAAATCLAFALFVGLAATSLMAQTASQNNDAGHKQAIASLFKELGRTQTPGQSEMSPDGRTVAWVAPVGSSGNRIHLTPLNTTGPLNGTAASTRVISVLNSNAETPHPCNDGDVAWSHDSRRIAFTSDCATPGQQQVFLVDAVLNDSGASPAPRRLTTVKGNIHNVTWSPDGTRLSFLFVENATRTPGALSAIKPMIGEISTKSIAEVQRVAVIDVSAENTMPQIAQVTPANLHVYEFDWSPNSQELAYIGAPPPGEDNWWVAQLYTQPVANGTPHSILKPKLQIAVPRWSPDGKRIAFIQGLMSDEGFTGGDAYVISATGGAPRNLTQGRKASPVWPHWIDNQHLGFTESVDGESRFSVVDTTTGLEDKSARVIFPATIGDGVRQLSLSFSKATNGRFVAALIQSSFNRPPEIWAGPLNNLTQITHLNDALEPAWGKSKSLTWNNEGFRVQGWLIYPRNYDPQKKYPLILSVHGGPANKVMPAWPSASFTPLAFSMLDYFVLMPNPRGSYGEGEAFTQANRRDFGYGDLRDLLAGVDTVTKRFPIDTNRVGITGWSYGGFMTMFAITQTHRFRAAMAGAGISDWKSYYGENSIDQWMIPFFGASVYDDPAVYAKSSAINYIKNARTPTLIVVGDRDGECPAPQSFEMWHALRAMNVPVKLVVYPNEGHGFSNPNDYRDVLERAAEWFGKYMPPTQTRALSPDQR
jgi:dipeptidyl aminopeptidase/acylaminoacyl peptidase